MDFTTEGMAHRVISPETLDDDVIHTHARHRVDNHGSRARSRVLACRRERRLTNAALRSGDYEDE